MEYRKVQEAIAVFLSLWEESPPRRGPRVVVGERGSLGGGITINPT